LGKVRIALEDAYIICRSDDLVGLASNLIGISGIDSIAIASEMSSRFSDVTRAISQAGSKSILPREKFYVKVIQTAKADYVDRDIEFASSGALVEKLIEIHSLPARNEREADRVILVIVGKKSAYVCVKNTI
jgi:hypothetical protein